MKCSVCEKDFERTIQVTLFEELYPTKFMCSSTKIVNLKTMCMECFFRISSIAEHIKINGLPEVWFKEVNKELYEH